MIYFIAIGAVSMLLIIWIISVQKTLVTIDSNIDNAMSQISIQLSSRWDSLTSLLELTKEYAALEGETFTKIIQARQLITKDSSPEDINKQEELITEALERVNAIAEHYPELKGDVNYIKTINGVKQYENMLRVSRLIYNDSVAKLNREISMFPALLIACVLGFRKRTYLEAGGNNI